jgi:hypothetical protein
MVHLPCRLHLTFSYGKLKERSLTTLTGEARRRLLSGPLGLAVLLRRRDESRRCSARAASAHSPDEGYASRLRYRQRTTLRQLGLKKNICLQPGVPAGESAGLPRRLGCSFKSREGDIAPPHRPCSLSRWLMPYFNTPGLAV